MSTLGATYLDLIDLYKRSANLGDQQIATVIELLAQSNPILEDAITLECNQGTQHLTTVRTGLPSVTWGKLYQGTAPSKSTTAQVTDATGFCQGLSSIDKRLLDIAGPRRNEVRLSEAKPFLEALSQEMASTIFYGSAATPEEFIGLGERFNDSTAANGGQIVKAGGASTDNTSIWFVMWGENQTHLLYPQGTKAGVMREDKGEQRVLDGSSNPYWAMEELFTWHNGLTVRDWRYVSRIANIDVSDLEAGTVDIWDKMSTAFWKIHRHQAMGGRMAIYMNSTAAMVLDKQSTPTMSSDIPSGKTGTNIRLRRDEIDGKEVLSYRGIPIRRCDAILNTETAIS